MGKRIPYYLASLLLSFVCLLVFVPQAYADIDYDYNTDTISLSYSPSDFQNLCPSSNFWLITLSYDNQNSQVQGSVHAIDGNSVDDSFSIPDGTVIQSIEVWTGDSEDSAHIGGCVIPVESDSGGIFTWNTQTAPKISNILVSNVTSSSVTISWTTNQAATSVLNYGTTSSYGSNKSDSSATTSHSFSLAGLATHTTYHYRVNSSNSNGSTSSSDNSFTTSEEGSTSSNQSGSTSNTTKTTTRTVTIAPTSTPAPDRSGPSFSLTTDLSKPYVKAPTIVGKASDPSGVARVQYSIDNGANWNSVDAIPNPGATTVTFSFTPPSLEDDNYKIRLRAFDNSNSGNTGISDTYTLIIDRLPPRIGGTIIAIGPQILLPNTAGYLLTSKGVSQKITLAAVGGPINLLLSAIPLSDNIPTKTYTLTRNTDNGLWSTNLVFDTPGIYQLSGRATDGANNTTDRILTTIAVLDAGKVMASNKTPLKNAQITLYYFEEKYQVWRVWNGPSYNQKNPLTVPADGTFSYLVSSGKYYFDIQAGGFGHAESEIFTVDGPTVLNPTFTLKALKVIFDFGFFKLYLPNFSTSTVPVKITTPILETTDDALLNQPAPTFALPTTDGSKFNLTSTRGAPTVLTFLNIWSPQATEQIAALDQLNAKVKHVAVLIGDSQSKAATFHKQGAYKTPLVVDSDAVLVDSYALSTLPTHYFIDRRGIVNKIMVGVLNNSEIEDIIKKLNK